MVWLDFTDVTHRSSSSLGSFLLMTASSLFVNIWKATEERTWMPAEPYISFKQGQETLTSPFLPPNFDAITQLKDSRSIKERINDSNLLRWDRDCVAPWETVRVSGDKGGTLGRGFCLVSKKNQLGTLNRQLQRWATIVISRVFFWFTLLHSAPPVCDSAPLMGKSGGIELMMMFLLLATWKDVAIEICKRGKHPRCFIVYISEVWLVSKAVGSGRSVQSTGNVCVLPSSSSLTQSISKAGHTFYDKFCCVVPSVGVNPEKYIHSSKLAN